MKKIVRSLLLALAVIACGAPAPAQVSIPFPGPGLTTFAFATFDAATLTGGGSLSGGNLTYTSTGSVSVVRSSRYAATKFYMEVTINTLVSGNGTLAIGAVSNAQGTSTPSSIASVPSGMWMMRNDALALNNGSSSGYGGNYGAGAKIAVAVDNTLGSGSGKIWLGTCSAGTVTWYNSGNPASGTNAMFSNLSGNIGIIVNTQTAITNQVTANFGASAFSCTPPSGFSYL